MDWKYKNITISTSVEGYFIFNYKNNRYEYPTLNQAKRVIDEMVNDYYTFNQADMDKLMKKLSERERKLICSLYHEIDNHCNNAYCQVGITENCWDWNFDFNKDY